MKGNLPTEIDAWPLAARVAGADNASPNGWWVAIVDPGSEVDGSDAFVVELRSLIDDTVGCVSVHSPQGFIEAIEAADTERALVVSLESHFTEQDWRAIDLQRSRLMRKGATVLVVGTGNASTMVSSAPNLWSWIGGEVWCLHFEGGQDD
jgi:hypothetical protein